MIGLALALLVQSPIELVESWPVETTLDQPDLRDADVVWKEMIERARRSIDFAEFYASSEKARSSRACSRPSRPPQRAACACASCSIAR